MELRRRAGEEKIQMQRAIKKKEGYQLSQTDEDTSYPRHVIHAASHSRRSVLVRVAVVVGDSVLRGSKGGGAAVDKGLTPLGFRI
jgi:hypothetical protein